MVILRGPQKGPLGPASIVLIYSRSNTGPMPNLDPQGPTSWPPIRNKSTDRQTKTFTYISIDRKKINASGAYPEYKVGVLLYNNWILVVYWCPWTTFSKIAVYSTFKIWGGLKPHKLSPLGTLLQIIAELEPIPSPRWRSWGGPRRSATGSGARRSCRCPLRVRKKEKKRGTWIRIYNYR